MYISANSDMDNPAAIRFLDGFVRLITPHVTLSLSVNEARTIADRINALLDHQQQTTEAVE